MQRSTWWVLISVLVVPVAVMIPGRSAGVTCTTDANCDDGDPCTDDTCEFTVDACSSAAGAFVCHHVPGTAPCCPGHPCHFQCYEARREAFAGPTVDLRDQFGSVSGVLVERPERLCAPADKNGEDPDAVDAPDHLTGYRLRHPFLPVRNQRVTNQFGTVLLDVLKPDWLLVPSAKRLGPPSPAAPLFPTPDHFKCYKVRPTRGSPRFVPVAGVEVEDQLGSVIVTLKRPVRLCAPVDKNGEKPGAHAHPDHLLCYRTSKAPFGEQRVFLADQFGQIARDLIRREELCVPSRKNPPLCGNGVVDGDAGEQCEPPDFPVGVCAPPAAAIPCLTNADCATQCVFPAGCGADQVCDAACRCRALADFCMDKTPTVPAMARCVFPETNVGMACTVNADCDSFVGMGDGICNTRQHRGEQRPLQGGWNAANASDVPAAPTCLRLCTAGAIGAACGSDQECNQPQDGDCGFGLCNAPLANANNPCPNGDRDCDSVQNGVCQAAGQACATDGACASGACGALNTLGSFPRRDEDNQMVLLSNNHVFARASGNISPPVAVLGETIKQPPVGPAAGSLADYEWLCFSSSCTEPLQNYGKVCTANPDCDVAPGDGVCTPVPNPACTAAGGLNRVNRVGANCIDAAIGHACPGGATILDGGDILDVGVPAPFPPSRLPPTKCTAPPASVGNPCTTDATCDSPTGAGNGTCEQTCDSTLPANAVMHRIVRKSGARTGLTCGRVTSIDVQKIPYPVCTAPPASVGKMCRASLDCDTVLGNGVCLQRPAIFRNQWVIKAIPGFGFNGHFSCGGDSSSLIVGVATKKPIGLLFGGNPGVCKPPGGSSTYANPIDIVLGRFRLHF